MTSQRANEVLARVAGSVLRTRALARAPIALYRARLGGVFGHRLLMLEHTGRVSGARRFVVLEVVDHPSPGEYVVASGLGWRAQWLRNVLNNPEVRVSIGGHRPVAATATLLEPDEASAALRRYAAAHPRAWRRLKPIFEHTLGAAINEAGTSLPLITLRV